MPSINSLTEACRDAIEEARRDGYLEGQRHILEHLGHHLEHAERVDSVRLWQQGQLALIDLAEEL
jgi:hypothetical protein